MKNEHVTNLELSQRLRELGYPQEESLFYWVKVPDIDNWFLEYEYSALLDKFRPDDNIVIAAPIATELEKYLPGLVNNNGTDFYLIMDKLNISYLNKSDNCLFFFAGDTACNRRARMLIWLVENGYVSFKS